MQIPLIVFTMMEVPNELLIYLGYGILMLLVVAKYDKVFRELSFIQKIFISFSILMISPVLALLYTYIKAKYDFDKRRKRK